MGWMNEPDFFPLARISHFKVTSKALNQPNVHAKCGLVA